MKKENYKENIMDIRFIFAFRIRNIIYDTYIYIYIYNMYLFLRKLFALIFVPTIKKQFRIDIKIKKLNVKLRKEKKY